MFLGNLAHTFLAEATTEGERKERRVDRGVGLIEENEVFT